MVHIKNQHRIFHRNEKPAKIQILTLEISLLRNATNICPWGWKPENSIFYICITYLVPTNLCMNYRNYYKKTSISRLCTKNFCESNAIYRGSPHRTVPHRTNFSIRRFLKYFNSSHSTDFYVIKFHIVRFLQYLYTL